MALAGAMRDRAFASLDELRGAVRGWLDEYNSRPFQKRDGSRRSVFESDERPLLIPLPGTAYEVADWIYGRKVQSNCHVAYARNWYSVPYAYAGTVVDLRVGSDTLEVWHKLQALHAQTPARHGGQPIQHERDRPAREGRMEAMGPGTLRAMGETRRTGLRGRRREAVRRAALRRPGGGARVGGAAALETLFRAASRERVLAGPAVGRLAKVLAHQPILETGQDMTGGLTETSDDGAGGWVRGGDYYANMGR